MEIINLSNGEVFKSRGSAANYYGLHKTQFNRMMQKKDFFFMYVNIYDALSDQEKQELKDKHKGKDVLTYKEAKHYKHEGYYSTDRKESIKEKLDYIISLLEKTCN